MNKLNPIFLPEPSGLYNTGSICYFNSLLQILASCTCLHNWKSNYNLELENEFASFIKNSKQFDPMASTRLLSSLKKCVHNFGNGQESASEALTLMLNAINNNELNNMFIHRFKYNIKCLSCFHSTDTVKDHSILFEFFHISELNADNMLNYKHVLTDYKCEKCNNIGAVKDTKLTMLPEIIIGLFNIYHHKKIHDFPELLEFPGINAKKLKYKLIGQLEHTGSLNGGHYWSRALRKDGVYLFDDISFRKSFFTPTVNTYIIVYHLI